MAVFPAGADAKAEAAKVTEIILSRWKNEPLGLIEDGTIHGRELVETVRSALADIGLTPTFSDTYRPAQEQQVSLVRRLAKSGVTHVFTGGDRADTAIIARDAASEKLALTLMGGETLDAANVPVPLANGVLAVSLPDYATLPDAKGAVDAMTAAKLLPEGYVLPAFAAVTLLEQAKDQAGKDGGPLLDALAKGPTRPSSALSASTPATSWQTTPTACCNGKTTGHRRTSGSGKPVMRTGPRNAITDVGGLKVGNAQDHRLKSGVSAVVCDQPAVAAVQVLGGAPGTRKPISWNRTIRSRRSMPSFCRAVRPSGSMQRRARRPPFARWDAAFPSAICISPSSPPPSCSTSSMAATRTGAFIRPIANWDMRPCRRQPWNLRRARQVLAPGL